MNFLARCSLCSSSYSQFCHHWRECRAVCHNASCPLFDRFDVIYEGDDRIKYIKLPVPPPPPPQQTEKRRLRAIKTTTHASLPIVVKTPVIQDTSHGYNHVVDVLDLIRAKSRLRDDPWGGSACSVGYGASERSQAKFFNPHLSTGFPVKPNPIPVSLLTKAAALMWAMDGFLSHAHPPERTFNRFGTSIRMHSVLAQKTGPGPNVNLMADLLGQMNLDGVINIDGDASVADTSQDTVPTENPNIFRPNRLVKCRFPALHLYNFCGIDFAAYNQGRRPQGGTLLDLPAPNQVVLTTVMAGVDKLLNNPSNNNSASRIASFLSPAEQHSKIKLNYDFSCYLHQYEDTHDDVAIVFREASGSASKHNICQIASEKYFGVIHKLARAETAAMRGQPHGYDMIELLEDMAVAHVAAHLEQRLREDPKKHWYGVLMSSSRRKAKPTAGDPVDDLADGFMALGLN
ncbi:hypothetical protein B0H66DRAFT_610686 [Apodospora peruviana]|uniref:Uncharacterized protein n=1 Tax=Apodospora peruviana TaxID=516989 RepID=A0AAE0MEX0_9PEZI|nr:hypothetical protein B0H66DRAFT_610686 [Apodospora peruviana]